MYTHTLTLTQRLFNGSSFQGVLPKTYVLAAQTPYLIETSDTAMPKLMTGMNS